ncbi:CCR4-NOT transcription complex subunit 6-like [Penaeus indicus]|uniref:CCR4-NOT transcription complex subunit 6-like n=1 Tax=Penaeus indicus TaxID=29960 RepID=UPI00300DBBA5
MSRTPKEGKESKPHRVRSHTIMGQDEVGSGKKSYWPELEITGNIRNISPAVWSLQHLTSLYLNDNCLSRIPAEIARLEHLMYLDLSCNKIRSLPAEIGELTRLRSEADVFQQYLKREICNMRIYFHYHIPSLSPNKKV